MATIRAKHYDEDEQRLSEDPIVIQMANELPNDGFLGRYLHESGDPTFTLPRVIIRTRSSAPASWSASNPATQHRGFCSRTSSSRPSASRKLFRSSQK